ncbi:MAG: hypothetical protein WHX93_09055 [bacterium]
MGPAGLGLAREALFSKETKGFTGSSTGDLRLYGTGFKHIEPKACFIRAGPLELLKVFRKVKIYGPKKVRSILWELLGE